jgi:hypothetical protein
MPKFRVQFEYEVTVPEKGTSEYEGLVEALFYEHGRPAESVLPSDKEERETHIEASLIYFLVAESHVGNETERVELIKGNYDAV